jgi:hypothetical protein
MLGCGAAQAVPIWDEGTQVLFTIQIYDASTVSYSKGSLSPGQSVCTTPSGCDTAAGQPPGGAPQAYSTGTPEGIGYEDSWGIGNVSVITDALSGDPLWFSSTTERLTAMFYGIVDDNVVYNQTIGVNDYFTTFSYGGYVDIYSRAGALPTFSSGPNSRTDIDTYPTATSGELFLRLMLSPGVIYGDTDHTFTSSYNTGSFNATGLGYMDVIGGSYAYWFDSNSAIDPNGGVHDFEFSTNVSATAPLYSWSVRGSAPLTGAVPAPGALLLLGSGLVTLVGLRRRRAH